MTRMNPVHLLLLASTAVVGAPVTGCAAADENDSQGTAGSSPDAGPWGSGGANLGGNPAGAIGGTLGSGGALVGGATGGMASGGQPGVGGSSSGGQGAGGLATGGVPGTGGYELGSGGVVGSGGAIGSGGATGSGGAIGSGGATGSGGAIGSGGDAAGGTGTGGDGTGGEWPAIGGTGTGGEGTGGEGTGGTGTGGDGTGGAGTGGEGTGGDGTGGAFTDITIWIAGDSTVANGSTPCPAGWGKHFEPYFDDHVSVVNSAVGGRSIQTWLYDANVSSTMGSDGECVLTSSSYNARWTAMLDGMQDGDYLFIQFGINDGDSTCPRHVGGALYMEYLGYMADAAKERGTTPIFLTPTAAIQCSGSTAVGNRGFLTETRNAATDNEVTLIDLNQLSVELYNSAGLCPNSNVYTGDDAVGQFFCNDHTHFEDAGATQIAGAVAQAIADQGLPLAAYLF